MKPYRLVPRFSAEELELHVKGLADRINRDYEGKSLLVVGILKGPAFF